MYGTIISIELVEETARVRTDHGTIITVTYPRERLEKMRVGGRYLIRPILVGNIRGYRYTF